jgi:hypothetical protein
MWPLSRLVRVLRLTIVELLSPLTMMLGVRVAFMGLGVGMAWTEDKKVVARMAIDGKKECIMRMILN